MRSLFEVNNYEKIILRSSLPNKISSILAGTSRYLRISYERVSIDEEVARTVASDIVAPLVFSFCWWVLYEATKNNIERIYFLARDGKIFYEVAQVLKKNWNLNTELRYLYCSRESLLLPAIKEIGNFEIKWITSGYLSSIDMREILCRLNLTPEDLAGINGKEKIIKYLENLDMPVSKKDFEHIVSFLKNPELLELLHCKTSALFRNALGYLLHEGFGDKVKLCICDSGWLGTSQYAISCILSKGGLFPEEGLEGYYIGINRDAFNYLNNRMKAFLFDWRSSRIDETIYNFICFEMLFSSVESRTIKYEFLDGKYMPIFDAKKFDDQTLKKIRCHHEIAKRYAEEVSQFLRFDDFIIYKTELKKLCYKLIKKFITSPSQEIASVYGDWMMGSETRERDYQCVAPSLQLRDVVNIAVGGKKIKGFWPQGSLVRGRLYPILILYNCFLKFNLLELWRKYVLRY